MHIFGIGISIKFWSIQREVAQTIPKEKDRNPDNREFTISNKMKNYLGNTNLKMKKDHPHE